MTSHPVHLLRIAALTEGVSFLILLGIAMPLKYWAGLPMAVKIVGWIHGLLFIWFCLALVRVHFTQRWPWLRSAGVLLAALLPFGPFMINHRLQTYEK